ncbi:hypothetical protein KIW84_033105 [Lathyrus oleraceus]|uniref:Reverse transcriptase zinc-binding domain-containing protein n=1 Tax=Pisum sativum TaxID=3888 RepID=A0A9D4XV31_PEA|nr:hypothetical protein KIW84_033105 [Pisum sativum]
MDKVREKLAKWKGKLLSLRRRITLIKSVMSSVAIFLLSFYKASDNIWKEIEIIQKQLMWGDYDSKKKIHWVAWNQEALWSKILATRYSDVSSAVLAKKREGLRSSDSAWWRDVIKADTSISHSAAGFAGLISCSLARLPGLYQASKWKKKDLKTLLENFILVDHKDDNFIRTPDSEPLLVSKRSAGDVLFSNRLHKKDNLRSRGVIIPNNNYVCSLCKVVEEDLEHLFFRCDMVSVAWRKIVDWLNITLGNDSAWEHFASWSSCCMEKKEYRGKKGIVWLVVMWSI